MKTTIILVRHAECIGNIEGRLSGRTNFKLTERGIKQAEKLAKELKCKKINCIYSSPLERAVKTANEIAKYSNVLNVNIVEDLIEIDYGVCDGMRWTDIDMKYPNVRKMWKEIYNYPIDIPMQESYKDVQKRMVKTINKIEKENQGKVICVVSHGIAIQSYLCYLYKKTFKQANEIPQLQNTEYIELINMFD